MIGYHAHTQYASTTFSIMDIAPYKGTVGILCLDNDDDHVTDRYRTPQFPYYVKIRYRWTHLFSAFASLLSKAQRRKAIHGTVVRGLPSRRTLL